jgi:hypothetical protein
MTKAGSNEAKFLALFSDRFSTISLNEHPRYVDPDTGTVISVDFAAPSLSNPLLVEVDSGNEAKLLVGQYTLLNELYDGDKEKALFLVIHFYKKYNPHRTIKNFRLINKAIYQNQGLNFCVLSFDEFKVMSKGCSEYPILAKSLERESRRQMGDDYNGRWSTTPSV